MWTTDLRARHFSDTAAQIVQQVWSRWLDRPAPPQMTGQAAVGMTLWALLRWERKLGVIALERIGADPDALARDVDAALTAEAEDIRGQSGPPHLRVSPAGQLGFVVDMDGPMEPVLAAVEHEALGLGHDYVGTEHLVLAAVRTAGPHLRAALDHHRVTYDQLRQAVVELLRG